MSKDERKGHKRDDEVTEQHLKISKVEKHNKNQERGRNNRRNEYFLAGENPKSNNDFYYTKEME